jgi:hypothetical protein
MSVKVLLQQIEISFWDAFIPLMYQSRLVRFIAPRVYLMLHNKELRKTLGLILASATLGLAAGFIWGALSQM